MAFHFFLQALFFLCGLVCFVAALCNWDWFFTTRNAHSFYRFYFQVVRLLRRRSGAPAPSAVASRRVLRFIYAVGGLLLLMLSVWFFRLTCQAFGLPFPPF